MRVVCTLFFTCFAGLLVNPVSAVEPNNMELLSLQNWVRGHFNGETIAPIHNGYLEVDLEHGSLLKNMATTKVYHKQLGALPLKIHRKTFEHGLYMASPGTIRVLLPSPARRFKAVFGIDSNRVTSFYSNAGRGAVVGSVVAGEKELYQSPVMSEGITGQNVSVPLGDANSFDLIVRGNDEGIIERVDFNQADWADAQVELIDGRTIRIGDLPTAPIARAPSTHLPFSFVYNGQASSEFIHQWEKS